MAREDLRDAAFMRDRNYGSRHRNYLSNSLGDDFSRSIDIDWVDRLRVGLRLDTVVSAHSRHNLGGLPRDVHIVHLPVPAFSSETSVAISIDLHVLFSTHGELESLSYRYGFKFLTRCDLS